ncbi:uncharacterized protein LOC116300695 [Actinia tenebrosa]|uniref:Uncharacterized protein LOC116300695 n=1 Tax=Actinia tenebrosa TaxID=6105 RepID=A0A6P8IFE7_ACTTE|nr:uncharacterized protein LOC116300695 [Actinia tenebrosa]
MADGPFSGTGGSETSPSSAPLYYEVSPEVTLALRIYGGITAFLVLLALIFCLVKGADDSVMYLLAVNMLMSSFIGAVIAWWYHKGIIEANKIAFIVFVGLCIIFQAIMSDIYVYRRPTSTGGGGTTNPTPTPKNVSTPIPTTSKL